MSTTSSQSAEEESLLSKILACRKHWPPNSSPSSWFVPEDDLARLITPDSIFEELGGQQMIFDGRTEDIRATYRRYHREASKLFAVLLVMGKVGSFVKFVEEDELSDNDLPFTNSTITNPVDASDTPRPKVKLRPHSQPGKTIKTMRKWKELDVERFESQQWSFLAPSFDNTKLHEDPPLEFPDSTIFPFVKDEERHKPAREPHASFSKVWKVEIHPAHRNFLGSTKNEFAIKRLNSPDVEPYEKELKMLRAFAKNPNSCLIDLCASYTWKGQHHFIFKWADMTLLEYYETDPAPQITSKTIMWVLQQCRDIAFGLYCMHDYRNPTNYEGANPNKEVQRQISTEMSENFVFAQHGDIKPSNLLWVSTEGGDGRLILADFGLSTFHKIGSKSNMNHRPAAATYAPPDAELGQPISLRYDIWSLGCVFLEFITWLLLGNDGVEDFVQSRKHRNHLFPSIRTDEFYLLFYEDGKNRPSSASVRPAVTSWIANLRHSPQVCAMLKDFLDLIQDHMICIPHTKRFHAEEVYSNLAVLYKKASTDPTYLEPCGLAN